MDTGATAHPATMPPVQSNIHADLEGECPLPLGFRIAQVDLGAAQIKDIIQDLFRVMVVTSHYDTSGRPSKEVLSNSLFVPLAFPPPLRPSWDNKC